MGVETLSELQIWIEGKFELVSQAQATMGEDVRQVRTRVHDLGNEVAKLLALDIEGKFRRLEEADTRHETNITTLTKEAAERRGAISMAKIFYTIGGAVGGYLISIALALFK